MNSREKMVTALIYSLFALYGLLLGFGWQEPGPETVWNSKHGPFEILGFYTGAEPGLPSSENSMVENSESLTFVAPFFYRVKPDGSGIEKWNETTDKQIEETVNLSHKKNVKVLALIHNLLYGNSKTAKQAAHGVLNDPADRRRFIGQALQLVKSSGYDGVNIDIEHIYPRDGKNFSLFIKELKTSFSRDNLLVTVSVPAKTRPPYEGQWGQHFDYKEIGKWADRVVVMAYDEHGFSSGPGPIASTAWLEKVIRYSLSVIPGDKVLLGVPAYGFDWPENGEPPRYLSFQTASEIAESQNVTPGFDPHTKVPFFSYKLNNQNHQVWFEDAHSTKYKIELAQKHKLRGIAIWRLGMEDPAIWKHLKKSDKW